MVHRDADAAVHYADGERVIIVLLIVIASAEGFSVMRSLWRDK